MSRSGASAARVIASVAYAVFRLKPERPRHAPVRKWVTGSMLAYGPTTVCAALNQLCVERDLCISFEQPRDGAAVLGIVGRGFEALSVGAGNFGSGRQVNGSDGESFAGFFKLRFGRGLQGFGIHAGLAEFVAQGHGEAAGMGSCDQLFGIGADAVFKARAKGILGLFQHPALAGNGALAVLQSAAPNGACCA